MYKKTRSGNGFKSDPKPRDENSLSQLGIVVADGGVIISFASVAGDIVASAFAAGDIFAFASAAGDIIASASAAGDIVASVSVVLRWHCSLI